MEYYIAQIESGKDTGKFYGRNTDGDVTPLFNTVEELETAIFKRYVIWENLEL